MDRAVSTTVSYVLSVAIAAMLVSGLLMAGSNFVTDRREQVARTELRVIGQQVATALERVDRLVVAGDGVDTARVNVTFPQHVTGSTYTIKIAESPQRVLVNMTDPDVAVEVHVDTSTGLTESSAGGGTVTIWYNGADLEVRNA